MKTRNEAEELLIRELIEHLLEEEHETIAEICALSMVRASPWRVDGYLALLDQIEAE